MSYNTWGGLSALEDLVMEFLWTEGSATADQVQRHFAERHPMKNSTVRTVLRRLEAKGFLTHAIDKRTFLYRPVSKRGNHAARTVGKIVDRFCDGSIEQLLLGMVDADLVEGEELEQLARRVAASRKPVGRRT